MKNQIRKKKKAIDEIGEEIQTTFTTIKSLTSLYLLKASTLSYYTKTSSQKKNSPQNDLYFTLYF
jgi:hypothetical protein